jgi:hypothetical protein
VSILAPVPAVAVLGRVAEAWDMVEVALSSREVRWDGIEYADAAVSPLTRPPPYRLFFLPIFVNALADTLRGPSSSEKLPLPPPPESLTPTPGPDAPPLKEVVGVARQLLVSSEGEADDVRSNDDPTDEE